MALLAPLYPVECLLFMLEKALPPTWNRVRRGLKQVCCFVGLASYLGSMASAFCH